MSSRINATGQAADHGQSRVSKLVGELLGRFRTVIGRASRADNSDGMMIAVQELAPHVEYNRRRMDLAECSGIRRRLLRDNSRTEIADPFKLGGKIDRRFP